MQIDMSNKVALVTGASRGIGKAISEVLGDSGATIAIHCNSNIMAAEELASKIGHNSKAFQADLSDMKAVSRLFHEVFSHFGQLDVLVNNAGIAISSDIDMANEQWVGDWEKTMAVNLTAPALLCKLTLPHFILQKDGIIINISSRAAHRGDTADYMAYASSKGGLEALTKTIARAYGKQGITAFGVAPGFTRTEMARDFIDTYGEDYATKDIALAEMTEPTDVAQVVCFLASGLAKHATGTTVDVNAASYVR
ncbi:3-oxoacyl-[acyl-carrier protein] reductase [Fulvivirga imtechensis AK7]|uniref:3-oxoacyl-[acyl-carrier protein] reductase n=1 Tax=Fulvivirga imtechensis AK7 TaxID=1237149 RepID=L8JT12_9BACT|nr:SDR family oxidoreductase [Fulvivirga imtechensis]ELR71328.1 3-oxoacyl-[acyl-carrier protein] reductase [Fulvivirga imtechensis AK7]